MLIIYKSGGELSLEAKYISSLTLDLQPIEYLLYRHMPLPLVAFFVFFFIVVFNTELNNIESKVYPLFETGSSDCILLARSPE